MKIKILLLSLLFLVTGCIDDDIRPSVFNEVQGIWDVTGIQNAPSQGPITAPPESEIITIIFSSDFKFSGTTSINNFNGGFSINGNTLTLIDFITTEALDADYGQLFYEALDNSDLKFSFSFTQEGNLRLGYSGSNFLILEKQ